MCTLLENCTSDAIAQLYVTKFSTISLYFIKVYVTESYAIASLVTYSDIRPNLSKSVHCPKHNLNVSRKTKSQMEKVQRYTVCTVSGPDICKQKPDIFRLHVLHADVTDLVFMRIFRLFLGQCRLYQIYGRLKIKFLNNFNYQEEEKIH